MIISTLLQKLVPNHSGLQRLYLSKSDLVTNFWKHKITKNDIIQSYHDSFYLIDTSRCSNYPNLWNTKVDPLDFYKLLKGL